MADDGFFGGIGDWLGNQASGLWNGISGIFGGGSPQQQSTVTPSAPGATASPQGMPGGGGFVGSSTPLMQSQQGQGGFFNGANLSSLGGISNLVKGLSPFISGGAGLASLIKGPGSVPYNDQQAANASQLASTAQPLINAANTGQLPAGQEAFYDQQLQSTINGIKAKYAQLGLSGSTMEHQDLANAQSANTAAKSQAALAATQEGAQMLEGANSAYGSIAQQQTALDQEYQQALAELSGMGGFAGTTGTKSP